MGGRFNFFMKLIYKAQRKDGTIATGEAEAADEFALAREMKEHGDFLITAHPVEARPSIFAVLARFSLFGKVSPEETAALTRNLGAMITAGLPLARSLAVLARQARNRRLKEVVEMVREDIVKGSELNIAMKKAPEVFSPLVIAMVKAGEESGGVADALTIVATQLEQSNLLRKRVRGAMIYPSIVVIALLIVGFLMMTFVVPALTATFKELNVELPAATRLLILISDTLAAHTFSAVVAIAAFIFLARAGIRTKRGTRILEAILMRTPIIGPIIQELNTARTARTLSSLLSSGVGLVEALTITEEVVQNSYYKDALHEATGRVEKGVALSEAITKYETLYPPLMSEMIAVGEETGKLTPMLSNVTDFYENNISQVTKDLSTIIEPILMAVIGAGVGFFAFSMITPLYTVLQGV